MGKFEVVDHTADIGIIAYGSTPAEVFINAAIGMFSLITDLDKVGTSHQQDISLVGEDYEELLITWLNELLYYFDAENIIFSEFIISSLDRGWLVGSACGEAIDLSRHEIKTAVKAATYHQVRLKKENTGYSAQVILDV